MQCLYRSASKAPAHLSSSSSSATAAITRALPSAAFRSSSSSNASRHMLSGSSGSNWNPQQQRRAMSVSALFSGFKWPFGGGGEGGAKARRRGCELAPKEAPEGLKLATFGGG